MRSIRQLETRSQGSPHRCLFMSWAKKTAYAFPLFNLIQQRWLPLWSAQPWLASADRNADRLSSLSERQPRTLDSHVKSRVNPSTVSHSQTSHPENIRAHFTSACISSTAVELLSNSIKASTAKSYNCSWSKWNCWCDKRQSNPIFCPIEDILTFLADQYCEGKEYRTINVLR